MYSISWPGGITHFGTVDCWLKWKCRLSIEMKIPTIDWKSVPTIDWNDSEMKTLWCHWRWPWPVEWAPCVIPDRQSHVDFTRELPLQLIHSRDIMTTTQHHRRARPRCKLYRSKHGWSADGSTDSDGSEGITKEHKLASLSSLTGTENSV